jgi:hypothetical protein
MEFPRDVTDAIHARSGGVPRLINVIADATLVFGYGEERSEIDAGLVREVIQDLDATGVLGPRSNANRHESVVPVEPVVAGNATLRLSPDTTASTAALSASAAAATMSGFSQSVEAEKLQRALDERERALRQREQEMALREKELAEQRRVLAEQYRLLRTTSQAAQPAAQPVAAGWPPQNPATPIAAPAPAAPPQPPLHARTQTTPFAMYQPRRRPSVWRRFKNTLLGTPEPVLEDSL